MVSSKKPPTIDLWRCWWWLIVIRLLALIRFEIFISGLDTFVQTLAVPRDPALDAAVLRPGLQHELVQVVGPGHVQCPVLVTASRVVSA